MTLGAKMTDPIAKTEPCDCLTCRLFGAFEQYQKAHGKNPTVELEDVARFVGTLIGEGTRACPVITTVSRMSEVHAAASYWAMVARGERDPEGDALIEEALAEPENMREATDAEIEALLNLERRNRAKLH